LRRNDLGAGLMNGESDDGGFDEVRLFCPNRRLSSAFSDSNASNRAVNRSTNARSSPFSTARSS
jgi:hypothetical protein